MKPLALHLSKVGKAYPVWTSNLKRYASWFLPHVRPAREFWALQNIDIRVRRGEAIAFIGQNGAGKSTLLKIVTGTVQPTTGVIETEGRISAILELGLGFNPELTGRQNIFQAGGLMGFSREQLNRLMPDIEDFAEIGEFFDQPLRVYSSGMQARLAFSLATAVRPDVLIVDEVLAVGDSYFQHKSFDRIRRFKEQGTSILLVTHNLNDVRALCDRVVLLDHGKVMKEGAPDEVLDYFNAMIAARENERHVLSQERDSEGWLTTISGSQTAAIEKISLYDAEKKGPIKTVRVGDNLVLRASVLAKESIDTLVFGVMLRNRAGQTIWGSNTAYSNQIIHHVSKGQWVHFEVRLKCWLGPGSYAFTTALTAGDTHLDSNFDWRDNVLVFDVVNNDRPFFTGSVWLDSEFSIEMDSSS